METVVIALVVGAAYFFARLYFGTDDAELWRSDISGNLTMAVKHGRF